MLRSAERGQTFVQINEKRIIGLGIFSYQGEAHREARNVYRAMRSAKRGQASVGKRIKRPGKC